MLIRVLVYQEGKLVAALKRVQPSMPSNEKSLELAEEAFRLTNTIDEPWWQAKHAVADAKKGCRSTSVGDTIVIRSQDELRAYRVANVGFERLAS